jgi:predicted DNA-binding transcriptional regulator AlpA
MASKGAAIVRFTMRPDSTGRKLNTREAAEYLGTSASTLNKKRVAGNGPAYLKIGHLVRYDLPDLDAYASAHRRRNTSETA